MLLHRRGRFFSLGLFSLEELSAKLLKIAEQAAQRAEVPAAAMVCEPVIDILGTIEPLDPIKKYRILSISSNRICNKRDPTAHSEVLALQRACRRKKNERLTGCIMLSTLEPCLMCSGAVILARLARVYYFAPTQKGPGMEWILRQIPKKKPAPSKKTRASIDPSFNHYPALFHLKEAEAQYQKLLRSFFKARRK